MLHNILRMSLIGQKVTDRAMPFWAANPWYRRGVLQGQYQSQLVPRAKFGAETTNYFPLYTASVCFVLLRERARS
jgi:hypothetical protein